jgi:hypothetical protein
MFVEPTLIEYDIGENPLATKSFSSQFVSRRDCSNFPIIRVSVWNPTPLP